MSQLNDISLVAQVVVFRNTRAFDQLVQKYQSPVRRFFLNLTCGDSELSDDLAQDTFIKAYTNIANFKNLSSFSTWLYRIAYNVFYDYIRSRKETTDLDAREVDAVNSTEQVNVGEQMDVYQSLRTLKEIERTCITLFYMEDVSIEWQTHERTRRTDVHNYCNRSSWHLVSRKNKKISSKGMSASAGVLRLANK